MGAGDYRKPVTLERPVKAANELGEQEITWEPFLDLWVSVTPLRSNEILWARQAQLQTTHRVRCRWFTGLTTAMRFTWQEPDGTRRVLNISSKTNPDERHVEWVLDCSEKTSG